MSKTDTLPKWICTECWHKTEEFHRFHRSVQHAQANYLSEKVKCELIVDPLNGFDEFPVDANTADIVTEPEKSEQSDSEFEPELKQISILEFSSENDQTGEIDDDILTNIKQDEDEDEEEIDDDEEQEDKIGDFDLPGKKSDAIEIKYNSFQKISKFNST